MSTNTVSRDEDLAAANVVNAASTPSSSGGSAQAVGKALISNGVGLSFAMGGSGGTGGTGGDVSVLNEGQIITLGDAAHGIVAQSVGGGGGHGGATIAGAGHLEGDESGGEDAPDNNGAHRFSLGGSGGEGNRSGDVMVNNSGTIDVSGRRSYGVYAQSVGGGGGDGGVSINFVEDLLENPRETLGKTTLDLGLGGSGGTGADSGDVTIDHTGTIIVRGDDSYGIYAQSVGGGGGQSATGIKAPSWMAENLGVNTILGAGSGGDGKAGKVNVSSTGDILVLGARSQAIFTQSVNGGGGNAELLMDLSNGAAQLAGVGSGQSQQSGPDLDSIAGKVNNVFKLGAENLSIANAQEVVADHAGDIQTMAADSVGSLTQSIGGGGGNVVSEVITSQGADVSVNALLGATNSSEAAGGDVRQSREGSLATLGDRSQGTVVQSIGGGGGVVSASSVAVAEGASAAAAPVQTRSLNRAAGVSPTLRSLASSPSVLPVARMAPVVKNAAPAVAQNQFVATLGATGGVANHGGDIDLNYAGDVMTTGERAHGVMAQSVGGGGGTLYLSGYRSADLRFGGNDGARGDGGNIGLTNRGNVTTTGRLAHGIVLQSVGGGGGMVFTDGMSARSVRTQMRSGGIGSGGDIRLVQTGDVLVTGKDSMGIMAQSIGGGGGIVDRRWLRSGGGVGRSGDIDLNLRGSVRAMGRRGTAVFAQSSARNRSSQGDISITVRRGETISAGRGGIGIHIVGGRNNTVTNHGTILLADGLTGDGIISGAANELVTNTGLFYGEFDLGGGKNTFINERGATFIAGPQLSVGRASNLVINRGDMFIGDANNVQRTSLRGGFVQEASGTNFMDLDLGTKDRLITGGEADRLDATGRVSLDGKIAISLMNAQLVAPGKHSQVLFSSASRVVDDGVELITPRSVVINYGLDFSNRRQARLGYEVDFSPDFGNMGPNLVEVGDYFNRIQLAGSSTALADVVLQLISEPTLEAYKRSLSQMSPDFYGELQGQFLRDTQRFGDLMVQGGEFGVVDGESYFWVHTELDDHHHDARWDYKNFDSSSERAAIGVQHRLSENWVIGGGFGLEDQDASGYDGRWNSRGDSWQLGVFARRSFGKTNLSASFAYAATKNEVFRRGFLVDSFTARSQHELDAFTWAMELDHEIELGRLYLRPNTGFGITRLMAQDASEVGAGALNLDLHEHSKTHAWVRMGADFGVSLMEFDNGLDVDLVSSLGYQVYVNNDNTVVKSSLQGAPNVDPMNVSIELNQSNVHGSVGLQLDFRDRWRLGAGYSTILDEHATTSRWYLGASMSF